MEKKFIWWIIEKKRTETLLILGSFFYFSSKTKKLWEITLITSTKNENYKAYSLLEILRYRSEPLCHQHILSWASKRDYQISHRPQVRFVHFVKNHVVHGGESQTLGTKDYLEFQTYPTKRLLSVSNVYYFQTIIFLFVILMFLVYNRIIFNRIICNLHFKSLTLLQITTLIFFLRITAAKISNLRYSG